MKRLIVLIFVLALTITSVVGCTLKGFDMKVEEATSESLTEPGALIAPK